MARTKPATTIGEIGRAGCDSDAAASAAGDNCRLERAGASAIAGRGSRSSRRAQHFAERPVRTFAPSLGPSRQKRNWRADLVLMGQVLSEKIQQKLMRILAFAGRKCRAIRIESAVDHVVEGEVGSHPLAATSGRRRICFPVG